MQEFSSVDEILDFAIGEEEAAAEFYSDLAKHMDKPWMREVFEGFAAEERGHKKKLEQMKAGKLLLISAKKLVDLKIAEYVVDVLVNTDMDYQDALIVAMKKEKAAFKLYHNLAACADDEQVRESLLALAQEEAKHKLRFEIEYDQLME